MDIPISKELRRFNHLLGETDGVYHDLAVRMGLSDSVMRILYSLCGEGEPCPLRTVIRQSGASKQTINSAIRRLEREGLVRLEPGRGREKNVRLTDEGRALAGRTVIPLMKMEDEIYSSWSREDVRKNLELAERFLSALREKTKQMEF